MKAFLNWCRRYLSVTGLAVIAFIVYMLFFQDNSVGQIQRHRQTGDSLQTIIDRERDTLQLYRNLNINLDNQDPATIERIVREQHNMQMPDEDVYLCR